MSFSGTFVGPSQNLGQNYLTSGPRKDPVLSRSTDLCALALGWQQRLFDLQSVALGSAEFCLGLQLLATCMQG